jgi:hypothetical protein
MLKLSNLSCFVGNIQEMTKEVFDRFDTIVLLNPTLEQEALDPLLKSIQNGTSMLLLISLDVTPNIANTPLLAKFGIKIENSKRMKKVKMTYTPDYIVSLKRGSSELMHNDTKKNTAFFNYPKSTTLGLSYSSLIKHKNFDLVIRINYGKGMIIIMNSFSLPEVRAELLSYSVKHSNTIKNNIFKNQVDEIETALPHQINEMFKVYNEVSLEQLANKMNIDSYTFDDMGKLLPIIEGLVTSNKILASIKGDVLVKKDPLPAEPDSEYFG